MGNISVESLWRVLKKRHNLSDDQMQLFMRYLHELQDWNQRMNLTAIYSEADIIELHFQDSLALGTFVDLKTIHSIADVGSGAGLPGIALKIGNPALKVMLLEVRHKKIEFLEHIIGALNLQDTSVCTLDWRTFLRKTAHPIDLFCSRASLEADELIRMFKPSSPYKNAQLVYWAASTWVPSKKVAHYVVRDFQYFVGGRSRRLVLFKLPEAA